jgi:RimJ/RimL family protein N-acetyltransferase
MDNISNDTTLFSEQRSVEANSILGEVGVWKWRELPLTKDKIDLLWTKVQNYRSLFSDLIPARAHAFLALLENPYTYWIEVLNDKDETVGVIYLSDMQQAVDANIHLIFFDGELTNKAELVKEVIEHLFRRFPGLHRLSASIPSVYFATKRLAVKVGFKQEGNKVQALLIGGRWCDETIYGVLAKEVLRGSN